MHERLTKHRPGSLKEIFFLSAPLFLGLVSSSLMLFSDRWFLSHYSLEAFNAVGIASTPTCLFQTVSFVLVSVNQVFIGHSLGKKKEHLLGPYTWQTIWCSVLIMCVIIPSGLMINHFYFAKSEMADLGRTYFSFMVYGNFLFSLGATLAAFQIGLGKTKMVTLTALIANLLNCILDYVLIYGIAGLIPPLGVSGSAIATLTSQFVYCIILFCLFIGNPLTNLYQTHDFRFQRALFWESLKLGAPRAFARFINYSSWVLVVYLLTKLGGDYVTVLSFGGTILFLIVSFGEAIENGVVSLYSFSLGQENYTLFWKNIRVATLLLIIVFIFLGIPLLGFQKAIIHFTLPTISSPKTIRSLQFTLLWVWVYFFIQGFIGILSNAIFSMKQTKFLLKVAIFFSSSLLFFPFYLGFHVRRWSPDKIWLCTLTTSAVCIVYIVKIITRIKKLQPAKNLLAVSSISSLSK